MKLVVTDSVSNCAGANNSLISNLTGTAYQWQVNTGNGLVNITDNINYSGSNTKTLLLSSSPSAWYGYQYRCVTDAVAGNIYTLKFAAYWSGAVNTLWNNPLNWNCAVVPDANTDAFVNNGTVLVNATATCRTLTLAPAVVFTVNNGITLNIYK